MAHQARFLAISNMAFHHNLSTIFGGWVPRTIMAYRHMNFCGFQNHCEPDLRISYYHPLLVYYNTGGFGIWQFPPKKHATYTTKNLVGQFSNIWMNLAPFFIQPPMYIRKKNYSRNLSLVLEMIVENSEFWIPTLHTHPWIFDILKIHNKIKQWFTTWNLGSNYSPWLFKSQTRSI